MGDSVNMFGKSNSPKSPTRLQKQAPTALQIDCVPENPFLQHSCDDVAATTSIPLLSPLFVSPNPPSSPSREGDDFMIPVGSQPSVDHKEGWQYSAKADQRNQMALLNMFHTKFVLVDHSH